MQDPKIKICRYKEGLSSSDRMRGLIFENNEVKIFITPLFNRVFRMMTIYKNN